MARHLLVTNDYPPKTGGIQVYLHELWRRLEPDRAVVVTATSHPDAEAFDATSEIVIERIPTKTLFLPTWRAKRAIESAIARHQPELVLLDPAWPLGLLGPRLSVPYGVVVHGAEVTVPGRIPDRGLVAALRVEARRRRDLRRLVPGVRGAPDRRRVRAADHPGAARGRHAGASRRSIRRDAPRCASRSGFERRARSSSVRTRDSCRARAWTR